MLRAGGDPAPPMRASPAVVSRSYERQPIPQQLQLLAPANAQLQDIQQRPISVVQGVHRLRIGHGARSPRRALCGVGRGDDAGHGGAFPVAVLTGDAVAVGSLWRLAICGTPVLVRGGTDGRSAMSVRPGLGPTRRHWGQQPMRKEVDREDLIQRPGADVVKQLERAGLSLRGAASVDERFR